MRFIKAIAIIIIISLFIAGCGRPGGKDEENATGSYLQVTKVSVSSDTVSITVENRFKDSSVTTPNSMYDVTLNSYTLTYFREDGSPILTVTHNNSIFIFIQVGKSADATITLIPPPSSISYSSASVNIFGTNGFRDKVGTTFILPKIGGGVTTTTPTTTPTTTAPTVTSLSPNSGARGSSSLPVTINGTNFVNGASVSFSDTGISISSTTFVSSTQITVIINIDSSATTGSRTVTVTNPDGQSATGSFTVT